MQALSRTGIHSMVLAAFALGSSNGLAGDGAPAIRVLVMDESRTRVCGDTWDMNFLSGNVFGTARNWVLNPLFFGAGGVVDRAVELESVPAITNGALLQADVVFLSSFGEDLDLSACELERLQAFVDQGGGLFVFENEASELYSELFGGTGSTPPGSFVGTFEDDIVNQGPFGNIVGFFMDLNFHLSFDVVGAKGRPVLSTNGSRTVAAAYDYGLGRAVLVNDEEWVSGFQSSVGCGVQASNINLAQDFFLNSFDFVTPAPGFVYLPIDEDCCLADLTGDGVLDFFDVSAFLSAFGGEELVADFTQDGVWDFFDVSAFLSAFSAGCP